MKKVVFIILIIAIPSCNHSKNSNQINYVGSKGLIKTYSSPSAYYGKPVSRMYINPYEIRNPQHSFDNDSYYVPPTYYGIRSDDRFMSPN